MADNQTAPQCLECNRTSDDVPLIQLAYQGETLWICPQHLPLLIHKPAKLVDKLPGAASFGQAEHNH